MRLLALALAAPVVPADTGHLDAGGGIQLYYHVLGGAHRDPRKAADNLQTWLVDRLRELSRVNPETLVRQRFEKFRKMGAFRDEMAAATT